MSSSRLSVQPPLPLDQHSGRGGESIYQLSKSVSDWLSGDGKSRRIEPSPSGDRRSRATERNQDAGRGRRRSVSTSTESSLVSRSRSRSRSRGHYSRRGAHSPVSTDLGSRTSYSSSSRKSQTSHHHRHHHHHHHQQRRRDRSRSSSRSSSRERTKRDKQKALKNGLLLLGSVAAATAAAQKLWSHDATRDERKEREADRRDNRLEHHRRRRTSRERVQDTSNRERHSLKDGAGVKTTHTLPATTSVTPTNMRVEPPRSVYHTHYEETQYTATQEDDEAIWMPEEESISLNSRGEAVVERIERRVAPPSEAASKRKSHGGRRLGDGDAFRKVEGPKILDEWDPRWKRY